ncbi:MAG: T9SS type A sorting domain-containing protein, partial [Salibacteraceae bacterium]
ITATVLSGEVFTTCVDSAPETPDPQWGVNVENQGWVYYPESGACFTNAPNQQYSQNFNCMESLPDSLEVCYRAFEDDGTGCTVNASCLVEVCANFPVPAAGNNAVDSLVISNCCGNASWGSVVFDIAALGNTLEDSSGSQATACDSFYWPVNNEMLYVTGMYYDTLTNEAGCDSVISLDLTMNYSNGNNQTIIACDSFYWQAPDTTLFASGVYVDTLTNMLGCDSVATLFLTINNTTFSADTQVVCNSYLWPIDSIVYNSSGVYSAVIPNAQNCDSVVSLYLTVQNTDFINIAASSCDGYYWSTTDSFYTVSGNYVDTLSNMFGCDSIVSLDLTINYSDSSLESHVVCDSFFWERTGQLYLETGIYTDSLTNAFGCDSIAILDLKVNAPFEVIDSQTACIEYFWDATGVTYRKSGVYEALLTSTAGCDSAVTLILEVDSVDVSVSFDPLLNSFEANASNADFQWLECVLSEPSIVLSGKTNEAFSPVNSGFYAVEVTQDGCVDTSACYFMLIAGMEEFSESPFRIYPNPTSGRLIIERSEILSVSVVIVRTVSGAIAARYESLKGQKHQFQLPKEAGLYIVEVRSNTGISHFYQVIRQN